MEREGAAQAGLKRYDGLSGLFLPVYLRLCS
jgi:hypothetical protein